MFHTSFPFYLFFFFLLFSSEVLLKVYLFKAVVDYMEFFFPLDLS